MRTKVVSFSFFQELSNKQNIKALGPKMTKIASRGSRLKGMHPKLTSNFMIVFLLSENHVLERVMKCEGEFHRRRGKRQDRCFSKLPLHQDYLTEQTRAIYILRTLVWANRPCKNENRKVLRWPDYEPNIAQLTYCINVANQFGKSNPRLSIEASWYVADHVRIQSNLGITTTEGTGSKWSYFSGGLICQVWFENFGMELYTCPFVSHDISDRRFPRVSGGRNWQRPCQAELAN